MRTLLNDVFETKISQLVSHSGDDWKRERLQAGRVVAGRLGNLLHSAYEASRAYEAINHHEIRGSDLSRPRKNGWRVRCRIALVIYFDLFPMVLDDLLGSSCSIDFDVGTSNHRVLSIHLTGIDHGACVVR